MLTVKICREPNEIRRLQLPNTTGHLFENLSRVAAATFGFPSASFRASYLDDDGDWCCVSSEEELVEAFRFSNEKAKSRVLKLRLDLGDLQESEAEEKHTTTAALFPPSVIFVSETVSDGSEVRGETIRKSWRIKNNGPSTWPEGCLLVDGQDTKLAIPALGSGCECDVELDIALPEAPGRFKRKFVLEATPAFTGDSNLWIDVTVLPLHKPSAVFVKDIELEDDSNFFAKQWITKTWAFKNDGKVAWPANATLKFVSGRLTPRQREMPLPQAQVGEIVHIAVDLHTPARPGRHTAVFHLTANGENYDNHFKAWCALVVRPKLSRSDFLFYLPTMLEDPKIRAAAEEILGLAPGHQGINCDECKASPIRGIRFKCTVCPDFDLCSDCEAKGNHPSSHVLLKLKTPLPNSKVNALLRPSGLIEPVPRVSADALKADFVEDVNVPDGLELEAGRTIQKTWRVKNSGPQAWPNGATFRWVRGLQSQELKTPVACAAGETVDISVNVQVPTKPGRYTGHFRIANADGQQFGDKFFVDLVSRAHVMHVEVEHEKAAEPVIVTEFKTKKETVKAAKAAKKVAYEILQAEKYALKLAQKQAKQAAKHAQKQAKQAQKQAHKQAKQTAKQSKQAAKQAHKQAKKVVRQAKKAAKESKKAVLKADFVSDVTVPDGAMVQAGCVFRKTWLLKNTGSQAWPEGSKLIWVRGDLQAVSHDVSVVCDAGCVTEVSVDIKAPASLSACHSPNSDRITGDFRLVTPTGRRFGNRLWVDIKLFEAQVQLCEEAKLPEKPAEEAKLPEKPAEEAKLSEEEPEQAEESECDVEPGQPKLTAEQDAALATLAELGYEDRSMLISLLGAADWNANTVIGWLTSAQ